MYILEFAICIAAIRTQPVPIAELYKVRTYVHTTE